MDIAERVKECRYAGTRKTWVITPEIRILGVMTHHKRSLVGIEYQYINPNLHGGGPFYLLATFHLIIVTLKLFFPGLIVGPVE